MRNRDHKSKAPTSVTSIPLVDPHASPANASIGELVRDATTQISTLVRAEVELAKAEITRDVKKGLTGSAFFVVALVVLLYSTFFMFLFLAELLDTWMWRWAAFLTVFILMLVVTAVFALLGYRKVRRIRGPQEAIESVKETTAALTPGLAKFTSAPTAAKPAARPAKPAVVAAPPVPTLPPAAPPAARPRPPASPRPAAPAAPGALESAAAHGGAAPSTEIGGAAPSTGIGGPAPSTEIVVHQAPEARTEAVVQQSPTSDHEGTVVYQTSEAHTEAVIHESPGAAAPPRRPPGESGPEGAAPAEPIGPQPAAHDPTAAVLADPDAPATLDSDRLPRDPSGW